jgi:hypothetical protein
MFLQVICCQEGQRNDSEDTRRRKYSVINVERTSAIKARFRPKNEDLRHSYSESASNSESRSVSKLFKIEDKHFFEKFASEGYTAKLKIFFLKYNRFKGYYCAVGYAHHEYRN